MRALGMIMAAAMLTLLVASCGGSQGQDLPAGTNASMGLPAIADLPHTTSVVSNDTANGVDYTAGAHQADSGTAVVLESEGLTSPDVAYTVYQIPERPGESPQTITVNALYYDENPYEQGTFEGYWVAYGDFSSSDGGVWRFDGPFMQYQARVTLPAGVDVINDSGNIYVAVVLADGSRMKLGNVQIGYDAGEGYEAYRLAVPRGSAVGRVPQVVIDGDGNPQVSYLQAQMSFGESTNSLKIAKRVADEWVLESVNLPYNVDEEYAFACGSSGRRALVVRNSSTNDQHLLFDDGSGTFADVATLWLADSDETVPDVAFINGADDPTGELDTALAVYDGAAAWPNSDIDYYRYDGVGLPSTGTITAIRRPGKINLLVEDNQASVVLPVTPAYPQIDATLIKYSGVADAWAASPVGNWDDLNVEDDDPHYNIMVRPTVGGQYAGAFYSEDNDNIIFGQWDGVSWTTQPVQQVSCSWPMPWMDFETFSDGTVVFPTYYGSFNLAVYEGVIDGVNPFALHTFTDNVSNIYETSIAVGPDDTAHIVASNPAIGGLEYFEYQQGGTLVSSQSVDLGGDNFGIHYGPCGTVFTEDALHIFSVDSAHMRLLHSENRDGTWVREAQTIPLPDSYAYIIFGAGYMENTGQLYIVFIDIMDIAMHIAYASPLPNGEWNWRSYKHSSFIFSPYIAIGDDESNIGVVYITESPLTEGMINFSLAPLGQTPSRSEMVSSSYDLFHFPMILSHNAVNNSWNIISSDDGGNRTYLWHREAKDNWIGPHLIAGSVDPNDRESAAGITYDSTTGLARVLVYEEIDATNHFRFSIYGQQNINSWTFSPPIVVIDEDMAVTDMGFMGCAADEDGNPLFAAVVKPVADPTYDVVFYRYDGLGNWNPVDTWDSPLQSLEAGSFFFNPLAMSPDYRYAFAATEMDSSAPGFGRIWTYYPW